MAQHESLAEQFEEKCPHLRAVAYRMLGSLSEAEDAVQEAWIRLSRSDANSVDNLGGWLTTVVARVSLDMLRARNARREDGLDGDAIARMPVQGRGIDPEQETLLAESGRPRPLWSILDTLALPERLRVRASRSVREAVLRDRDDRRSIAGIAARQLACLRVAACRVRRCTLPTSRASAKSWTLSWRRRAAAIFTRCSSCWIRTS